MPPVLEVVTAVYVEDLQRRAHAPGRHKFRGNSAVPELRGATSARFCGGALSCAVVATPRDKEFEVALATEEYGVTSALRRLPSYPTYQIRAPAAFCCRQGPTLQKRELREQRGSRGCLVKAFARLLVDMFDAVVTAGERLLLYISNTCTCGILLQAGSDPTVTRATRTTWFPILLPPSLDEFRLHLVSDLERFCFLLQ